ncbi:MAG: glycerate kinase [Tannerella sp.]|nr:glycerate kinase [Tannerella sp.]
MKKIVVAVDSFKGCLSSGEIGKAAENGIKAVFPSCEVVQIPVADGGEGVLDVLMPVVNGRYASVRAHNPLMKPMTARYGISSDGRTGLIEMAAVSGLPLVPVAQRNPMLTTSFGTGELIRDALEKDCRDFVVGIGGSATNDAGLGMLQALGFRFLDGNGSELGVGGKIMRDVAGIDASHAHPALKDSRFTIACDVRNPFCGEDGAAYVYARQKGADDGMIRALDDGLSSLAKVILNATGKDIANVPGSGAAGGLGGGFLAFLNAVLKPGIALLLDYLEFDRRIEGADLIITGEGRVDRQSVMGKAPWGVLQAARKQGVPVVVIAGGLEDVAEINRAGFQGVFSITPGPVPLEKAMEPGFAGENIRQTVMQICRVINCLPIS